MVVLLGFRALGSSLEGSEEGSVTEWGLSKGREALLRFFQWLQDGSDTSSWDMLLLGHAEEQDLAALGSSQHRSH